MWRLPAGGLTVENIFNREQILEKCKAIEPKPVFIPAWNAHVKMKNITFQDLVNIRIECPDKESYQAMLISAVCEDLSVTDAYQLQKGNGLQFANLFNAVNVFLGADLGDEEIKK
jgi:hypothetical protein